MNEVQNDLATTRARMLVRIALNVLGAAVAFTIITALAFGWAGCGIAWATLGVILIGAGGCLFAALVCAKFLWKNLRKPNPSTIEVIAQAVGVFIGAMLALALTTVALLVGVGVIPLDWFAPLGVSCLVGFFGWLTGSLVLADEGKW